MSVTITNAQEATKQITSGCTIMIGGFGTIGTPLSLVDILVERGVRDLTLITNDTAFPNQGNGKFIREKRLKKLIASHIGTNPETGKAMNAGEVDVTLVPQGTLAERIRAGGAGLGGILTPTGVGTPVEEGKSVIEINGRKHLLELPLRAEFALIQAYKADRAGNLMYHGTTQNFNPLMAMAADVVIAEVDEIIEDGYLDPDNIRTPGILVDFLVKKVS